jgi:hypothetical protein
MMIFTYKIVPQNLKLIKRFWPTISHSSDINMEPALKPLASPVTVVKNETSSEDSFVIETAPEEVL